MHRRRPTLSGVQLVAPYLINLEVFAPFHPVGLMMFELRRGSVAWEDVVVRRQWRGEIRDHRPAATSSPHDHGKPTLSDHR
jgi:hypothetical protein